MACMKPKHGSCSVRQTQGAPNICCPNRLYADSYKALNEVAIEVFGPESVLVTALEARSRKAGGLLTGKEVVTFGKGWGGELALPRPKRNDGGKSVEHASMTRVHQCLFAGRALEITPIDPRL